MIPKDLRMILAGYTLYKAGLAPARKETATCPLTEGYPRNFTRDSIITGILMGNASILHDQLRFAGDRQGERKDPFTGEEPGKIFHEYPPVIHRGRSTEFNACDTTALYLIGHDMYKKISHDGSLAEREREHIERAALYILNHIRDGFFTVDPSFSDADEYALKVTYWKDSEVARRTGGMPVYPIVYIFAQIQNLRALRAADTLLKKHTYAHTTEVMLNEIIQLWRKEDGLACFARDAKGPIRGISSGLLPGLAYHEPEDVPADIIDRVALFSQPLETPFGYRTIDAETEKTMRDPYHARTIWPYEQAMINIAARKHNLPHVKEVSERIIPHIQEGFPEIFVVKEGTDIHPDGNDPQLWTIGARDYFAHLEREIYL
jgi:glycogen debranching enzyme